MLFDGQPHAVGFVGAKDFDTSEAWKGIVWGFVSMIWTGIVFEISWLGWRRVHAVSKENGVYESTS